MSSVSSLSVQQDVENWLKEIEDPVTLAPCVNAVTLSCGHNMGESTALRLFGKMRDAQVERPGPCPVCRERVRSYVANRTLRNLISQTQRSAASILPRVAQHMAEEPLPAIPFMGEKTELGCCRKWKLWTDVSNVSLIRKMEFMSTMSGSFLKDVVIYGDSRNGVVVKFTCKTEPASTYKRNETIFKKYFNELGLLDVDYKKLSGSASLPRELDWALHFLTVDNTIYQEDILAFIQKLLQKKNWRLVEEEMQPLQASQATPPPPAYEAPPAYGEVEGPPPAYIAPVQSLTSSVSASLPTPVRALPAGFSLSELMERSHSNQPKSDYRVREQKDAVDEPEG